MFKLFLVSAVIAVATADVAFLPQVRKFQQASPGQAIRILRQEQELDPSGSYQWSFESENGINAQEQGSLKQIAQDQAGTAAQGSFQYTSPEGVPVQIQYVADENGFQPVGSVIPTPPPIPEAIARSLEYIRTHPQSAQPQRPFGRF
ncbi:Insect cuticle protein [Popillia japonica]|uniref:Insect cuticle protein n=1 Tax=Popillia japonica TaxID=7064 RepID=A0AAW1LU60_POPJA